MLSCVIGCGEVDVVGRVAGDTESPMAIEGEGAEFNAAVAGAPAPIADANATTEAADTGTQENFEKPLVEPTSTPLSCAQATKVFDQALCACNQAAVFGNLVTTSLGADSSHAHVRVSGPLQASAFVGPLSGDLSVIGDGVTVLASQDAQITGALETTTDLGIQGTTTVGGNAFLGGTLLGDGRLVIAGDLHTPNDPQGSNQLEVGGAALIEALALPTPCHCSGDEALDIFAWVVDARTNNDNIARSFGREVLLGLPPGASIDLPPGRLSVDQLQAAGGVTLRVSGPTTLFIEEQLNVPGDLRAELSAGATLSIFVAGEAIVGGTIALGDGSRPGSGRLYVAGAMRAGDSTPVEIPDLDPASELPMVLGSPVVQVAGASTEWIVNLYAPRLALALSGQTRVIGSLYVASLVALSGLMIDYDQAVLTEAESCDAP